MASMVLMMHDVTGVKLAHRYLSNGGSREIIIERADGLNLQITLYGKTEDAEALPKADDFYDVDAKRGEND